MPCLYSSQGRGSDTHFTQKITVVPNSKLYSNAIYLLWADTMRRRWATAPHERKLTTDHGRWASASQAP